VQCLCLTCPFSAGPGAEMALPRRIKLLLLLGIIAVGALQLCRAQDYRPYSHYVDAARREAALAASHIYDLMSFVCLMLPAGPEHPALHHNVLLLSP
jgi:hypothetical protein